MSILLVAVAIVLALLYGMTVLRLFWRTVRMFWIAARIPGPSNGVLYFNGPMEQLLDKAIACRKKYGNVVRIWAWPAVTIAVSTPEDVEVICTNAYLQKKAPIVYDSLAKVMGDGLVSLNGETHRRHRRAISPSLHLDILQDFVPTFGLNAARLCKRFEKYADTGEEFDAVSYLAEYSAHSICETVFSAEFSPSMLPRKHAFVKYLHMGSEMIYYRIMHPWYSNDLLFRFSSMYHKYHKIAQVFDSFVTMMLDSKRDQLNRGDSRKERKRLAFLDHMLKSTEAKVLTDHELKEELKTVSGAAIGTSTDLMSYFVLIMALLPDIQEKLVQELDGVFGGSDRLLELDDLPHLRYLDCCIKETMRLFPPVFSFSRQVCRDVTLPSGVVLPRGGIACVVPYFTHRDPRFFPDPDKFDPSRFLPDNSTGRHPYSFIPFSAGVRNCIGQRYAMMSAKILSSSILRRFRILPSKDGPKSLQDVKIKAGVSSTPACGCPVHIEMRPSWGMLRRG